MNTLPPLVGLHSQQQAQQHQQGRFRNLRSLQNYEIAVAGYASSSAASPDPFVRSMSVTTTTTTTTTTTPQGVQPLYSHEPNHEQNHRMYMERQRQEYQQLLRLRHQVLQQQALHTYGPYQSGLQVPVRQQAVHPHPHPAAAFQRFVPVPLQHEHLQHQRVDPNHQTRQLMQGNAAFSMDVQLLLEQQRWIERQRVPHEMPASPLTPSTTPETSSVVATTASTYGAANTTTVPARAGVSPGRASVPSEENPKEDDDKANAGGSVLGPKEALSYGHLERREEKEEEEESVEDEDKDEDQEREQAKKGENLGAGDYHYANLLSPEPDGTSDTEVECTTRATTRAFLKQKNRGMKENVE
ncbi:hypothetical protein BGX34_010885 [Mortierella sp. NVP85]|nr:hypothetical protein BGX34_010885 [Mortierella sp. NVP85]